MFRKRDIWTLLLLGALALAVSGFAQKSASQPEPHLRHGFKELKAGNLGAARQQLLKAADQEPNNPQIYNLLGFISDQTGQTEEGIHYYQKALRLYPNFTPARNNLAALYLREGKTNLAIQEFRRSLQFRRNDLTAHYNLGLIYVQKGVYARALNHLKVAASLAPADPAVLFLLATAYFDNGDKEQGKRVVARITRLGASDFQTLVRAAALLAENQLYAQAASLLEEANTLAPHNSAILMAQAQVDTYLRQSDEALKAIGEFVGILKSSPNGNSGTVAYLHVAEQLLSSMRSRNPRSFPASFLLGEVFYLEKKYDAALEVLKPLSDHAGQDPPYLNLLGMSYAGANHLPEAAKEVEKAITLAPKQAEYYFNLASIFQKAGDNHAAIKILDRGMAQGNRSAPAFFALGLSYFNLGDYRGALGSFEKAVTLDPDFVQAQYFTGRCYKKLEQSSQAAKAYQKAIAIASSFYPAYYQLALLELDAGNIKEALPHLEQVTRLDPGYSDAHYQLGKIYARQGHTSDAINQLEKSIALNPNFDPAYYQLGRLYEKIGNTAKARAMFQLVRARQKKKLEKYQRKLSEK